MDVERAGPRRPRTTDVPQQVVQGRRIAADGDVCHRQERDHDHERSKGLAVNIAEWDIGDEAGLPTHM